MDDFRLEESDDGFGQGVIVGVADTPHRKFDPSVFQPLRVVDGNILYATVGVVHELIALGPGAGVIGDAIGLELFNRNFKVVDPQQASSIIGRYNLTEFQITKSEGLAALRDQGIDALLTVKSVSGSDDLPQSVAARVVNTTNGTVVAGLSWQNGWGGQKGSLLDRTVRKDLMEAAKEITDELIKGLSNVADRREVAEIRPDSRPPLGRNQHVAILVSFFAFALLALSK
jgi:hypothetical protein